MRNLRARARDAILGTFVADAASLGLQPSLRAIDVGKKWKKHTIDLDALGVEGFDLQGVFIGSSVNEGTFVLRVDDVAFE